MKYNIEKQHAKKKYHAVERLRLLLDPHSFKEIGSDIVNFKDAHCDSLPYDGVIVGRGTIQGSTVFVFSQDFTVSGGSIGLNHGRKIANIISLAIKAKAPVIGLYDSGGARISEGINSLVGCGEMMHQNTLASGLIPQISVVVGPCAGAAAYSPAITDFVFMVEQIGQMYITGNKVIEQVTGEQCDLQSLGGAKIHSQRSGVAHFRCTSEKKCFSEVRRLISFLPKNCMDIFSENIANYTKKDVNIDDIVPNNLKESYSIRDVICAIVDTDSFIEVHKEFAESIVVGFAYIGKKRIGIVANNPEINSGCIDSNSSDKAARFVRFCDSFNIPIVTLVDTPGYLPGISEEHNGIIRHGAKLLYAYSESTNVKITIILRKAYGGAYIAMGSKHLGADYVYACKNATLAVMGADGAVSILNRRELDALSPEESLVRKKELIEEYSNKYMNANIAASQGYIDGIIELSELRKRIFDDVSALENKDICRINKKHGNIPL